MSLSDYLGKSLSGEHLDGMIGAEFTASTIDGIDSIQAVMDRDVFEGLGEIESLEAAIMQFRPILATSPAKVLAQEVSAPQSRMEPPIPKSHPLRGQMMQQRADESTERVNVLARKAAAKLSGNDLIADARVQNAMNQAKAPKNWLDRAMQTAAKVKGTEFTSAAIAPATEVAHPAFVRKAKEIQQGGFIGGEVGRKAKAVVNQLKGRVAKVKLLVSQGAHASQNIKAGLESQAKKELANIIVDRARIERFRLASVVKLHSLHTQALAKKDLSKATGANAVDRAKLVASAEKKMKLSKMAGEAFKDMMTKPLAIPGMSDVLRKLNAGTTDQQSLRRTAGIPAMFNTVAPPRSMVASSTVKAPKANIPGVVRTSWHVKPGVAAVMASRAFGDFGDFEGNFLSDAWDGVASVANDVVDAATGDTARKIAEMTGKVAQVTGTVLTMTGADIALGIPGGGQVLTASGGGLTALAKVGVSGVKKSVATAGKGAGQLRSMVALHVPTSTMQKRAESVFFSIRLLHKQSSLGIELTENPQQAGVVLVRLVTPGPIPILGGKGQVTKGIKDAQWLEFELPAMAGVSKYVILDGAGGVFMAADAPKFKAPFKPGGTGSAADRIAAAKKRAAAPPVAPPVTQQYIPPVVAEPGFLEQHWIKLAIGAGVLVVGGIAAKKFKVFGELSPMEQAEQMANEGGMEGSSCGCGMEGLTPQQAKFKHAAASCKGRPGYRSCMSRSLKGR